jgi:hypothetical protein
MRTRPGDEERAGGVVFQRSLVSHALLSYLFGPVAPPGVPAFSATVSLIVLLAALFVILSKRYPPKVEHWAYATVGTVLGFWLRG